MIFCLSGDKKISNGFSCCDVDVYCWQSNWVSLDLSRSMLSPCFSHGWCVCFCGITCIDFDQQVVHWMMLEQKGRNMPHYFTAKHTGQWLEYVRMSYSIWLRYTELSYVCSSTTWCCACHAKVQKVPHSQAFLRCYFSLLGTLVCSLKSFRARMSFLEAFCKPQRTGQGR